MDYGILLKLRRVCQGRYLRSLGYIVSPQCLCRYELGHLHDGCVCIFFLLKPCSFVLTIVGQMKQNLLFYIFLILKTFEHRTGGQKCTRRVPRSARLAIAVCCCAWFPLPLFSRDFDTTCSLGPPHVAGIGNIHHKTAQFAR
jgi:hypothetical protein